MRELSHDKNDGSDEAVKVVEILEKELMALHKDWQSLFVWHDGPLVQAMRHGDFFLVDEISLAEDSVLERLNSVLEPKRLLVSDLILFL
jgi:midasin